MQVSEIALHGGMTLKILATSSESRTGLSSTAGSLVVWYYITFWYIYFVHCKKFFSFKVGHN